MFPACGSTLRFRDCQLEWNPKLLIPKISSFFLNLTSALLEFFFSCFASLYFSQPEIGIYLIAPRTQYKEL